MSRRDIVGDTARDHHGRDGRVTAREGSTRSIDSAGGKERIPRLLGHFEFGFKFGLGLMRCVLSNAGSCS